VYNPVPGRNLRARHEFKVHHRQHATQVPPAVPPPAPEPRDHVRRRAGLVSRQLQLDAQQLVVKQRGWLTAVHVVAGLAGRRPHVPRIRRPPSPTAVWLRRRFHGVHVTRLGRPGRSRPGRRGQDVVVLPVRRWRRWRERRGSVRGRHDGQQLCRPAPSPQPERCRWNRRRVVHGRGRSVLPPGGRRVRRGR